MPKRISRKQLEALEPTLGARDKEILRALLSHRYLTTEQIRRLYFTEASTPLAGLNEMNDERTKTIKRVENIKSEITDSVARKSKISRYLEELRQVGDIVAGFDENLWQATVESITVNTDKTLVFTFRDGTEIPVAPTENQ